MEEININFCQDLREIIFLIMLVETETRYSLHIRL
jgi:hypothetical protein